ncbi:hypothetical protein QRB31_05115 [Mycobacterium avium subsp. hominissuis]|nr:hypothetical protein [Mycobacterium avium]MDO2352569.1 hypothetical protein [Mycobacterium avium subsp. hominissuis]
MEDGEPASWEERALHVNSLRDPYNAYTFACCRRIGALKCRRWRKGWVSPVAQFKFAYWTILAFPGPSRN